MINNLSNETLRNNLFALPIEVFDHILSFLPNGHPLTVIREFERAFYDARSIDNFDLEKIQMITTRIWKKLNEYSGYLTKYCSCMEENYPNMSILWGRFAVRFPLYFKQDIRWKVCETVAECVKNRIIRKPDRLDYETHLWYPTAALRRPIGKNEFGIRWEEAPRDIEEKVLDDLAELRRDRLYIDQKAEEITCDCCGRKSKIKIIIYISSIISTFEFSQSLVEREVNTEGLKRTIQKIPPAEVSNTLSNKILDTINKRRISQTTSLDPAQSPNLKVFASFLENNITEHAEKFREMIKKNDNFPVGSSDIPIILSQLKKIREEDSDSNTIAEEMEEDSKKTLPPAEICITIASSHESLEWTFSDKVSWMNNDYRLKGITDLALMAVRQGYHVKLS